MSSDLYNYLNRLSNDELLNLYRFKSHEYRNDALSVMETILEERNIPFNKIEKINSPIINKSIRHSKENEPLHKKLFYKILLILMPFGIAGIFGKAVELEGKLFRDEILIMGIYRIYNILSFPFAFLAEQANLGVGILIVYILNIAFLAWVLTRIMMWLKRI